MSKAGNPERPRTTAMGLLTDAKEMLAAARILHESGVWQVRGPAYYLLGHAMEEALKSFLLTAGETLHSLKSKFGHDLSKAAQRAIEKTHDPVSNMIKENLFLSII